MFTPESHTSASNREFKASAFTSYFGEPENAADLYRGLSHCTHIAASDIEYKTLEGVLFLARKNDMAFTVQKKILVISEHQSTVNQNMPLRSAIYYGRTMENLVPPKMIYKTSLLKIPTPEFYVFYNGTAKQPPEKILKLSDAYLEQTVDPMLELTVRMININPLSNHSILKESRSVYEYAEFIQSIRSYIDQGYERDQAICSAMEDCVRGGIMVNFINKHGSEVRNMLFTQFNWDDALEVCREESYDEGHQDGLQEGLRQGICTLIETCQEFQIPREEALQRIIFRFQLDPSDAEAYMKQYWV